MASLVNKIRRMSYSGDNQHDETYTHAGFAVTAKNMSIINKGSKVKSSKKEIEWHVGLCVSVSKNVVFGCLYHEIFITCQSYIYQLSFMDSYSLFLQNMCF